MNLRVFGKNLDRTHLFPVHDNGGSLRSPCQCWRTFLFGSVGSHTLAGRPEHPSCRERPSGTAYSFQAHTEIFVCLVRSSSSPFSARSLIFSIPFKGIDT